MTATKKALVTLQTLIISTGKQLAQGFVKASNLHLSVLDTIAESSNVKDCKQRPVAVWFQLFVRLMNEQKSFEWPKVTDKDSKKHGDPIGYRTIINKAHEYDSNAVYAATYFNRLQSYLTAASKVQVVKSKGTKQTSRAHIVTKDAIIKRLDALFDQIPQNDEGVIDKVALTHLSRFASRAFGIKGYKQGNEYTPPTTPAK